MESVADQVLPTHLAMLVCNYQMPDERLTLNVP
jgi:hypothetical protein